MTDLPQALATSEETGREYEAERSLAAHVLLRAYQDFIAPRPLLHDQRRGEQRWAARRRDAFAWLFGLDDAEGEEMLRTYCALAEVSVGYLRTVLRHQHAELYRECAAELGTPVNSCTSNIAVFA